MKTNELSHLLVIICITIALPTLSFAQQGRQRIIRIPQQVPNQQVPNQARTETKSIEAESLRPKVFGGQASTQNMRQFGNAWSGNQQLFWDATRQNQRLELPIPVAEAGDYQLSLQMTKAIDFGDISIGMQGKELASFSGFHPQIQTALVNLGRVRLNRGENILIFNVSGKAARSRGFRVGIDRIQLTRNVPVQRIPPVVVVPKNDLPPIGNDQPLPPHDNKPPIEKQPRPDFENIAVALPTGLQLLQLSKTQPSEDALRLENWEDASFRWQCPNLPAARSIAWQVFKKPPPPFTATNKNSILHATLVENWIGGGIANSTTSNPSGDFVIPFADFQNSISDPIVDRLYVRAIPITDSVDKRLVGQPSNVIEIIPPFAIDPGQLGGASEFQPDDNAHFFSSNADQGTLQPIDWQRWDKDWSIVVPAKIAGSKHTDLLVYNRISGLAKFFTTNGNGQINFVFAQPIESHWDIIVPGNFSGDQASEFLAYSRETREAKIFAIQGLNKSGSRFGTPSLQTLKHYPNLRVWDQIIPGQFAGDGLTDLLFYSRIRGEGKFFQMGPSGNWSLLRTHKNWKKSWSCIVPGNFNGDSITDLAFYRRVIGDMKLMATDGAGGIRELFRLQTEKYWDLIIPGQFDSESRTDLVFYSRMDKRIQYGMVQNTSIAWRAPIEGVNEYYSHMIPGDFDDRVSTDLLAYDNHKEIRIQAIRCTDDDGGRAGSITPAQMKEWVKVTNRWYLAAGIKFLFDEEKDFATVANTTLNNLDRETRVLVDGKTLEQHRAELLAAANLTEADVAPGADKSKQSKELQAAIAKFNEDIEQRAKEREFVKLMIVGVANNYARDYYPGKLVVYVRHGMRKSATGGGHSGGKKHYVAMPGYHVTSATWYYQDTQHPQHAVTADGNTKLLAHEIGHYLGLAHTFSGMRDYDDPNSPNALSDDEVIADFISGNGKVEPEKLDGDRGTIFDTPYDVKKQYYLNRGWNPADYSKEVKLTKATHGIDLTFSPDRHNVISYWGCDEYVSITPDQVRLMRGHLYTPRRQHLLQNSPYITDVQKNPVNEN